MPDRRRCTIQAAIAAWTGFLLGHRAAVAAACAALTLAAAWSIPHLRFDLSIDTLLVAGDDDKAELSALDRALPPRPFDVACVIGFGHAIATDDLAAVGELARGLAALDDVAAVTSLATVEVVPGPAALPVPVPFPDAIAAGQSVAEAAARHPLVGRLLARDATATAILVRLRDRAAESLGSRSAAVHRWLRAQAPPGCSVRSVGGPLAMDFLGATLRRDMVRTLAWEAVACASVLALLLHSLQGTVLPLLVVAVAVLWSLGLLAATGRPMSVIDVTIPGLVTVIGICDAIHMVHHFEREHATGGDRRAAVAAMMRRVGVACLLTSATTGIGFLSLCVSPHHAVRELGWKACAAVGLTFTAVIAVLPLLLSAWPLRARPVAPGRRLPRLRVYGRTPVLVATLAVVGLSSLGAARATVDSYWLEELPADAPVVADVRAFGEQFAGLMRLELLVEGDVANPDVLRGMEHLQAAMAAEPGVDGCESITHWLREVLGNPQRLDDGDWRRAVALLRLAGDMFPTHAATRDFAAARVVFQVGDIGSRRLGELGALAERLSAELPPGTTARVTGHLATAMASVQLVIATMLESFLLSLAAITLLVAIAFRSARLALASVVPNVLPILVAVGLGGWLHIPIRIGIVMIYAVGIGLAVDDSIHLLARYAQERALHPAAPVRQRLEAALHGTGRALLVTSAILCAGCLCYLAADFRSIRDVGILLTAVVVSALLADLFLLPHLIELSERDPTR